MEVVVPASGEGRLRPAAAAVDTDFERRWLVLGTLAFRALALPCSMVPLLLSAGLSAAATPLLLAAVLAVGHAVALLRLVRAKAGWRGPSLPLLLLDTAVAVVLNLWAASTIPVPATETGFGLFWPLMQGAVVLWLAARGPTSALAVLALGALVSFGMAGAVAGTTQGAVLVVSYAGWLGLALTVAWVLRAVLRTRTRLAQSQGSQAERARGLRRLHDTALQSLEGIALLASAGDLDDSERLRAIDRIARTESAFMRRLLDGAGRQGLLTELASLVEFSRSLGSPAELVTTGSVPDAVPGEVQEACAGAVLEALTNARQHADPGTVVVRVGGRDGRLSVEVSDDGRGFDPAEAVPRFGMRHSIVGRVAEVGGTATVRSAPGSGTTVSLSFPAAGSPPAPTAARRLGQRWSGSSRPQRGPA